MRMAAVSPDVTIYADDADNCIARHRHIFVIIRRGRQTIEHVRRTREAIAAYVAEARGEARLGLLHVYEAAAELPDRECRRATAEIIEELGAHLACGATVIEGDGLRHAMLRLAVRSLSALAATSVRRFIGDSVDEAIRWLGSALPREGAEPIDQVALVAVVTGLRERRVRTSALPETVQR
jgi:hypothetical protein